jgi:hypothetical protein
MRTSAAEIDTDAGPSVIRGDMLQEDLQSAGFVVPKSETRRKQDTSGNIVDTKAPIQLELDFGTLICYFSVLGREHIGCTYSFGL